MSAELLGVLIAVVGATLAGGMLTSPPAASVSGPAQAFRWAWVAGVAALGVAGEAYGLGPQGTQVAPIEQTDTPPESLNPSLAASVASSRSPGERFRDCPTCPELVVVPAGSFLMGSPADEAVRADNEGPQHHVTIGEPLAVGVYEVTFAEWDACVTSGGCGENQPDDEGWGRGRQPVMNVSWEAAQAYVAWLSRETGKAYRLLSEAEWEYVARAGSTTRYWWGDEIGENRANCEGCGSQWDDEQSAPVGSFEPNGFGLYDVHGNVHEWVQDCWNENYTGAPNDGSALKTGDCSERVLRGGSWGYGGPWYLRSALRGWMPTAFWNRYIGFRIARSLE